MNYQLYFYLSAAFGIILAAINVLLNTNIDNIKIEKNVLNGYKEISELLKKKIDKQNQLLGTRAYQIKKRDEKISKLQKEIDTKITTS